MNITKGVLLTGMVIVIWGISLVIIQLLTRKEKAFSVKEGKIQAAYGLLFTSLIVAASLINFKVFTAFNEIIDITILKKQPYTEVLRVMALISGLSICWFIISYILSTLLLWMATGKRTVVKEMESNNWSFFLIRGVIFVGFVYSLMPILDILLRLFYPTIDTPFFH